MYFVFPYFYHDAFMHHIMHALDAPACLLICLFFRCILLMFFTGLFHLSILLSLLFHILFLFLLPLQLLLLLLLLVLLHTSSSLPPPLRPLLISPFHILFTHMQ